MRDVKPKLDMTILYAEDEMLTRQVFCEVLATRVKTVYQAANGREGFEKFIKYRPDVVLVDNNMPHLNGVMLARAILALDPFLPVVIVSGDIKRKSLLQLEAMNVRFIKKPIRIRPLLVLLQELAASARSRSIPAPHTGPVLAV